MHILMWYTATVKVPGVSVHQFRRGFAYQKYGQGDSYTSLQTLFAGG